MNAYEQNNNVLLGLSRGDGQLLALNYVNLGDVEYLDRLFSLPTEPPSGAGGGEESSNTEGGAAATSTAASSSSAECIGHINILGISEKTRAGKGADANSDLIDGWVMTADLPEDLVLFGGCEAANELSRSYLRRRFLRETSYSLKNQDLLFSLVFRQALVFEIIGKIMIARCDEGPAHNGGGGGKSARGRSRKSEATAIIAMSSSSSSSSAPSSSRRHFASNALLCAVEVLEAQSRVRSSLQQFTVEPLVSLLLSILREDFANSGKNDSMSDTQAISGAYLQYMRSLLCNSMQEFVRNAKRSEVSDDERLNKFRLCISCSYGLLCIGMYSQCAADMLVAISNLTALSALSDEWKEKEEEAEAEAEVEACQSKLETASLMVQAKEVGSASTHTHMHIQQDGGKRGSQRPDSGKKDILYIGKQRSKQKRADSPVSGAGLASRRAGKHDPSTSSTDFTSLSLAVPMDAEDDGRSPISSSSPPSSSSVASRHNAIGISPNKPMKEKPSANKVLLDADAKCRTQLVKDPLGGLAHGRGRDSYQDITVVQQMGPPGIQMQGPLQGKVSTSKQLLALEKVGVKGAKPTSASLDSMPGKASNNHNNNNNSSSNETSTSLTLQQQAESGALHEKVGKTFLRSVRSLQRLPNAVLSVVQECSAALSQARHAPVARQAAKSTVPVKSDHVTYVWSSGQNSYGELGHGDVSQRRSYSKMASLDGMSIASIGAGNEHSVFVDTAGKVFVCGYNENGQCGLGTTAQVRQISTVTALASEEMAHAHVFNGCEHTLLVTREGKLYSFGYNYRGQLGLGNTSSESTPKLVRSLISRKVVLTASSYHHSVILCADGSLFSVGRNDCGQLGHGDSIDKKIPQQVMNAAEDITSISCGQFHTVFGTASGSAYACGKNDYGQLGLDNTDVARVFTKLSAFNGANLVVRQVCCGYYHTLVLLHNGIVTGFGRNDYGQLGLGHTQPRVNGYHVISSLRDKNVTKIAAGCYHSIAVTANGMLYVFGRNNHGQLGTGDLLERSSPYPIDLFVGQRVLQIAAGFYHTLVLTSPQEIDGRRQDAPTKHALADKESGSDSAFPVQVPPVLDFAELVGITTSKTQRQNRSANDQHASSPPPKKSSQSKQQLLEAPTAPLPYSVERRSRVVLRDMLPYLVRCLQAVITKGCADSGELREAGSLSFPDSHHVDKDSVRAVSWVVRQLQAISTLLAVSRQYVASSHMFVEMPLGQEDAYNLTGVLLLMANELLKAHHMELERMYLEALENEEGMKAAETTNPFQRCDQLFDMHFSTQPLITAEEIIGNVHTAATSCFQLGDEGAACSAHSVALIVRGAVDKLRHELVHTFFFMQEEEGEESDHAHGQGGMKEKEQRANISRSLLAQSLSLLVRFFDCLFPSPLLRSQFLTVLGGNLTAHQHSDAHDPHVYAPVVSAKVLDQASFSALDFNKSLKLFSCVCARYEDHLEVVNIFQESTYDGLIMMEQLINVYAYLSMHCLKSKIAKTAVGAGVHGDSVDHCRTLALRSTELCLANFVKCAAPLILNCKTTVEPAAGFEHVRTYGTSVLRSILGCAVGVLDYLLQQKLSADMLLAQSHGTILSSILPSLLVFAIAFPGPENCVEVLLPDVSVIMQKLQSLDLGGPSGSTANSSASSPRQHRLPQAGSNSASPIPLVLGSLPDSPTSGVKKDTVPSHTWWYKLLKLAVILCSKSSAMLVHRAGASASASHTDTENSQKPEMRALQDITTHVLWRYLFCASQEPRAFSGAMPKKPTPVRASVRTVCTELRQREMITDHTYRLLYQSSKATKTLPLVEAVERIMLDIVTHVDGASLVEFHPLSLGGLLTPRGSSQGRPRNKRLARVWTQIVRFTKLLHSKRSQLCEHSGGMSWSDILMKVHDVLSLIREFLLSGTARIHYAVCALPCPKLASAAGAPVSKSSNAWKAFRRCTLTVLCMLRWKACRKANMHDIGQIVVDFVSGTVGKVTSDFTVASPEHVDCRWTSILRHLGSGSALTRQFACGLEAINNLIVQTKHVPMKADTLMVLTVALRESEYSNVGDNGLSNAASAALCCSAEAMALRALALKTLKQILVDIVLDFCSKFHAGISLATYSDLSYITTAIRLLHLLSLSGRGRRILPEEVTPAKLAFLLVLLVDESTNESRPSIDEKLSGSMNGASLGLGFGSNAKTNAPRVKGKAIKRAANAIISFLQSLSAQLTCESGSDSEVLCNQLLQVHSTLFTYFQTARLSAATVTDIDPLGGATGKAAAGADSGKGKDALSGKRRCQELISKPMEFCHSQEGFVIQGDKLLNNLKGMDFTLAMWVMPTQKSSVRHSFITGKISHNDAWPLLSRRSDGKIVVIYGHGNEFERLTSQASVPLSAWTHIAVVCEPKKIKLFINGTMDSQVNTKGNGRAVLYPVVLGSCPQGLRTRVEHVRDGFDGMLAQYKYYTRALSPIHVRVVFEQGAPESYDIKERWLFQLLASSRLLVNSCGHLASTEAVGKFAEAIHMIFITDSIGRLRSAALTILKDILALDALSDIALSSHRSSADIVLSKPLSLMSCTFLPQGSTSFYERMVWYFVRIMGMCWSPMFHAMAEDSKFSLGSSFFQDASMAAVLNSSKMVSVELSARECLLGESIDADPASLDLQMETGTDTVSSSSVSGAAKSAKKMQAFLDYAPEFLVRDVNSSNAFSHTAPLSINEMQERIAPREEACNDLCAAIFSLLESLAKASPKWGSAIGDVMQLVSSRCQRSVNEGVDLVLSLTYTTSVLDALGVAVLSGGPVSGACLGAKVRSYFSDSCGYVLSLNRTTGYAVVLSTNGASTRHHLSVVRQADLVGAAISSTPMPRSPVTMRAVLQLMNTLRGQISLVISDLLALHRMEHAFTRQTMLQTLRPLEVFLFMHLLRYMSDSAEHITDSHVSEFPELFLLLQSAALRVHRRQITPVDDTEADRTIPALWLKSSKYIATLPSTDVGSKSSDANKSCCLPLPEVDTFADYVTAQMGIAAEVLTQPHHELLLREGRLLDLIQTISVGAAVSEREQERSNQNTDDAAAGVGLHNLNLYSIGSDDSKEIEPAQAVASTLDSSVAGSSVPLVDIVRDELNLSGADWWGVSYQSEAANSSTAAMLGCSAASELNDVDSANVLRLILHMRRTIISRSRSLLSRVIPAAVSQLPLELSSWRISLWEALLGACAQNTLQSSAALNMCTLALSLTKRLEFTQTLASSLRYMTISMMHVTPLAGKVGVKGTLLESTDVFTRLLHATNLWLDLHERHEFEIDICVNLVKMLLPALCFIESYEAELRFMVICQTALRKLIYLVLAGASVPVDLAELARSSNFTLLRARAQECSSKTHGQMKLRQDSALAYHLTQLAISLEILQRYSVLPSAADATAPQLGSPSPLQGLASISEYSSKATAAAPHPPPLVPEKTAVPIVVGVRASSIDVNLEPCVVNKSLLLPGISEESITEPVLVEVQLSAVFDFEDKPQWSTVYLGTCLRFVQSSLVSGCSYALRTRVIRRASDTVAQEAWPWSDVVPFQTLVGIPFVFDTNRRGSDILLSEDGITASYAGDDCWSTVLGTRSFSAGITSWEIRVVQSSTAYIFVGVATSQADLNSFLGGCGNGWGFIGEQSLYHNREKVKVYGEAFTAGDVVGVELDLVHGQLSFSRNGKSLGVAFDNIYGELFPAAAFYNMGQELEILPESFQTTCPAEPVPCSQSSLNLHDASVVAEMLYGINARASFAPHLLELIADHCNNWCSGLQTVHKMVSGRYVVLSTRSDLLQRYGLVVGERVRTPFGVAEVAGSAYDRLWFNLGDPADRCAWFFSHKQLQEGRTKGMFFRCTYERKSNLTGPTEAVIADSAPGTPTSVATASSTFASPASPLRSPRAHFSPSTPGSGGSPVRFVINEQHKGEKASDTTAFDAQSLAEMINSAYWSSAMDAAVVAFLTLEAAKQTISVWEVTIEAVDAGFRGLQQQLSKLCMSDESLSHRWGFRGPKRRAVIARMAALRQLNLLLSQYFDVLACSTDGVDVASEVASAAAGVAKFPVDSNPVLVSVHGCAIDKSLFAAESDKRSETNPHSAFDASISSNSAVDGSRLQWPYLSPSWQPLSVDKSSSLGLLHEARGRIFLALKAEHFPCLKGRALRRVTGSVCHAPQQNRRRL